MATVRPALRLAESVENVTQLPGPLLQLAGVGKRYAGRGGQRVVLDAVDLQIRQGEFVSIIGPSGCGKSTLLRLVAGLDGEHDGTISLAGQAVRGTGLERGLVFQEHRLLPWLTVTRNIELGLLNAGISRGERQARVREHIALVRLEGFEDAYPHQLSGGMAQRVAIARALANRPRVLLLDEPFGALDAITRAHLQRELLRIWEQQGITMLLVTHDMDEAAFLSQRVVVMDTAPGRVKDVVPMNLSYPRDRHDEEFARARRRLQDVFGHTHG
ncbi:ABC transporter ATP-binding protein [Pseudoxanthomonas sp.]|uniref:ABC transporter ATP-binding protein n=1 Tax=Pseudoxanthomonas sp. TaxID=1871049 RepID=UPI0026093E43|nr:ABC transporter ATP-binding protein [Pseudoxanthomonas sp.]WDS36533.1 MAG: ABC transporter ATP-binding protein [Pseudoxanthomonas sp.]